MKKNALFAAISAAVLGLSWTGSAVGAVDLSSTPSHDGVVIVNFEFSIFEREPGNSFRTFMIDLNRVTAQLPIFDIHTTIYQDYCYPEFIVYLYYDVHGSEQAFRAQTEHLVRVVSALPGVGRVFPYPGASLEPHTGEPCLQSYSSSPGSAAPGAEESGVAPRPLRIATSPNPARGDVQFDYSISGPGGESSVEVFDIAGRRVAEVFRGLRAPGEWTARWQATDAQGRRVPQGTYFVLVRSGSQAVIGRFILAP